MVARIGLVHESSQRPSSFCVPIARVFVVVFVKWPSDGLLAEVIRFGVSWCFLPICLKSAKEAESLRSTPNPCHLTACVVRGNTVHNGRHPDGPRSEH